MEPVTAQVIKEHPEHKREPLFLLMLDRIVMYIVIFFTIYFGFICLEMIKVQQADNHKIAMSNLRHTNSIQYPYSI